MADSLTKKKTAVANTVAQSATELTAQADLNSLAKSWIAYLDASPKTIEVYTRAIRRFCVRMKEMGVAAPSRENVLTYRDELRVRCKPATVESYLSAVKLFFKWTEREGLYPNVADNIKGAKIDREHKRDYLTEEQARHLFGSIDRSTISGKRDYALLSLMVTTGLREISVVCANIEDIGSIGGANVLFYKGKGHDEKACYVKLSASVKSAILGYLDARGEYFGGSPLFGSVSHRNMGKRLTTRSISRICKTRFLDAGLNSDRLTGHSLRHTAATLNLLHGGTIEETQQLLGHADINTTMIYSHALERANNNSEDRISDAIFL